MENSQCEVKSIAKQWAMKRNQEVQDVGIVRNVHLGVSQTQLMAGLDAFKGPFPPKWFCDSLCNC